MKIVVDRYEINQYVDCPQKDYYRFGEHLVPKTPGSPSAAFGITLHEARSTWKKAYNAGDPDFFERGMEALWATYEKELMGFDLKEKPEYSKANAISLFTEYTKRFPAEAYRSLALEKSFEVFIGKSPDGHKVYRSGILDDVPMFD